jgi:trehalose 2-sulfotransferase
LARATYIVAATPRSGSSLLAEGLESTGVAGRPSEVFAPDFKSKWEGHLGLPRETPIDRYLPVAMAYGTSANGVYGLKIHWDHVIVLARRLGVVGKPGTVLDALYPGTAYVNIVRRDRRAQALSLFRATATQEWWRFTGAQPADASGIELDRDAVVLHEAWIDAQQRSWEAHFRARGAATLTVEYERLVGDYRGELARVLDFLGCDPRATAPVPEPRLTVQSDELNDRWHREMSLAETSRSGA